MFTIPERQSWMSTLARAELQQLEDLIESLARKYAMADSDIKKLFT